MAAPKGPSPLRFTVVKSTECDYCELSYSLRDTLETLKYNTRECDACGWIAHESAKWKKCKSCEAVFCDACVSEARTVGGDYPLLCEECDPAKGADERLGTSVGGAM